MCRWMLQGWFAGLMLVAGCWVWAPPFHPSDPNAVESLDQSSGDINECFPSLLYVAIADVGVLTPIDGATNSFDLILRQIRSQMTYFSDRPNRATGDISVAEFVLDWEGKGFLDDPPNAAIVLHDGDPNADLLVVTLRDPVYDEPNETLCFKAEALKKTEGATNPLANEATADRSLPTSFGRVSLFIDNAPPSPVLPILAAGITPANSPDFGPNDLTQAFSQIRTLGAGVAILSWDDPGMFKAAEAFTMGTQAYGVPVVLALGPTALNPRSKLVVPTDVQVALGREPPSFFIPLVQQAFIRDAVRLAALKPAFLCLGTEVNLLYNGAPGEFIAFVSAYHAAYDQIKAISPGTWVFTEFNWDDQYFRTVAAGGIDPTTTSIINAFRPKLDALAMSTYPGNSYPSPANIPAAYYQSMSVYRKPGELLFMLEIGWPTSVGDTVDQQVQFISRFGQLFKGMNTAIIAWSLLHDVPSTYMAPFLATTGLRTTTDQAKPSWQSFLKLKPAAASGS